MTTAELHKILDDENKKISLEEYQNVLYQLKFVTISMSTAEQFENQELTKKYHFYEGETNAFQIALDLSKHIEQHQNQKAIECLKDCEHYVINLLAGNYDNTLGIITAYIDNKIKELEGNKYAN